jgi:hypothetical protein
MPRRFFLRPDTASRSVKGDLRSGCGAPGKIPFLLGDAFRSWWALGPTAESREQRKLSLCEATHSGHLHSENLFTNALRCALLGFVGRSTVRPPAVVCSGLLLGRRILRHLHKTGRIIPLLAQAPENLAALPVRQRFGTGQHPAVIPRRMPHHGSTIVGIQIQHPITCRDQPEKTDPPLGLRLGIVDPSQGPDLFSRRGPARDRQNLRALTEQKRRAGFPPFLKISRQTGGYLGNNPTWSSPPPASHLASALVPSAKDPPSGRISERWLSMIFASIFRQKRSRG